MQGKLKFFLSLFLFVIFSTLISYHVIGDTKLSRIKEITFISENILLKKNNRTKFKITEIILHNIKPYFEHNFFFTVNNKIN